MGPAWSSFAVAGPMLFTQEQRGPLETVVCYDAETGREIWNQPHEARFDDPLGGPGPRATPTLANGGLFVTGATGMLLCLNPATGAVVWKQDLKKVAGREVPMWGFAASPLVIGLSQVFRERQQGCVLRHERTGLPEASRNGGACVATLLASLDE